MCDDIGKRISCQEDYGTIKYSGSIEGFPGIWLGIDWDIEERGKHNGTLNGVCYFNASYPTSGSFVRLEKLNFGQPLVDAIARIYGSHYDLNINHSKLLTTQHAMKAPFIELVGFEKLNIYQSDFKNLRIVNCRGSQVNSIGDIRSLCPNLVELNVSKNLLNLWDSVFVICSMLPHLQLLNISENRLDTLNIINESYPNITKLQCEVMQLTWNDLLIMSDIFPNLVGLYAGDNRITSIDLDKKAAKFPKLEILELIGNSVCSWEMICQLSNLPKLRELNLVNINLDRIRFPEDNREWFPELFFLNINRNHIEDWESIGQLNKIKCLTSVKCLHNPILETEDLATRDQIIISKIASLQILNCRNVSPEERRGSEYDYLKKYGIEWLNVKNTEKEDDFLKRHLRYSELIKEHGEIERSLLTTKPTTIKSALLEVTLKCDNQRIVKKLPPSMLVQKVVTLAQRLYQLPERPTLSYVSAQAPSTDFPLHDEYKDIGFYAISDGDTIIVKSD